MVLISKMTSPLTLYPPQALLAAFCDCIRDDIVSPASIDSLALS